MKNKHVGLIDKLIIFLCVFQVCIFNYWNISRETIKLICILIIISFVRNGKLPKYIALKISVLMCVGLLCFISFKRGHNIHFDVFMSNVRSLLYAFLPLIYFSYFIPNHVEYVKRLLLKNFFLINGYAILNMFISIFQVLKPGFMAGRSDWTNEMTVDLISGIFGYSCTPQFGMFFLYVFFYNIYCSICNAGRKYIKYYNIVILFYTLIISILNDNKAIYIELILFMVLYICLNQQLNLKNKMDWKRLRVYFIIFCAALLTILMYFVVPSFKSLLDNNLLYAIKLFWMAAKSELVLGYGSAERVYSVIHAFTKYDAIHFGYGTGDYVWQAGVALGFRHFGIADMGSFLCLGGVWFTISTMALYFWCVLDLSEMKKNIKKEFIILIILFLLFFYGQIVTSNTLNLVLIFMMSIMGMIYRQTLEE